MAQNGFFIMSDGRRSCDVVTSKPIKRKVATEKTVKTKDRGTQTSKAKGNTSKRANTSDQAFEISEKPKKKLAAASAALLSLDFSDAEKPKKRQKLVDSPQSIKSSPVPKKTQPASAAMSATPASSGKKNKS